MIELLRIKLLARAVSAISIVAKNLHANVILHVKHLLYKYVFYM